MHLVHWHLPQYEGSLSFCPCQYRPNCITRRRGTFHIVLVFLSISVSIYLSILYNYSYTPSPCITFSLLPSIFSLFTDSFTLLILATTTIMPTYDYPSNSIWNHLNYHSNHHVYPSNHISYQTCQHVRILRTWHAFWHQSTLVRVDALKLRKTKHLKK